MGPIYCPIAGYECLKLPTVVQSVLVSGTRCLHLDFLGCCFFCISCSLFVEFVYCVWPVLNVVAGLKMFFVCVCFCLFLFLFCLFTSEKKQNKTGQTLKEDMMHVHIIVIM